MSSDPEIAPIDGGMLEFNNRLSAATPPEAVHWPLPRQRRSWDELCKSFRAPRPKGVVSEDRTVPRAGETVPVRIYRTQGSRPKPGVIYLHGGGWVLGSIETHDDMCAEIAHGADVCVIAVDYRLAPEHPHPAQFEDNRAVLAWLRAEGARHGIDPQRIIAAGDSAGGQMTASLAMYLRDHREPQLRGQVLIYPVLGLDLDTPSYRRNATAPCLTREEIIYYWDSVLGPRGRSAAKDKYIVPLAETDFGGLPPAFITAAAHDPLYDDALIYWQRLREAGVPAQLRPEPALAHSYMRARTVSEPARRGFDAIVAAIRSLSHQGTLPWHLEI